MRKRSLRRPKSLTSSSRPTGNCAKTPCGVSRAAKRSLTTSYRWCACARLARRPVRGFLNCCRRHRLSRQGHRARSFGYFAICSFDFLALAEWKPLETVTGVRIARPEMMALANLLHHPEIADTLITGTDYKRSNKDLGRVLALAYLTVQRDRRDNAEELEAWAGRMWTALRDKFGDQAPRLAAQAGAGLRALTASPADLDQALRIANLGLLASLDVSMEAFGATGARFVAEVIEELERLAG